MVNVKLQIMEKEITSFELRYDGMYHIVWTEKEKVHKWYIYLSIPELIRMLEIEGITFEELLKLETRYAPIKFEKVTLRCSLIDGCFVAYGFFDEYFENTLNSNFTVELFCGDTLKNHEKETILGLVDLVDDKYEYQFQKAINPNFSK